MTKSRRDATRQMILLSGHDLRQLIHPQTAIEALRDAYRALADNPGDQGKSVGFTVEGGSIHVKSGLLPGSHLAFASKVNVNLPDNWRAHQLPTIQGVVVISNAKNGRPLAVMESMTLTAIRTAATAALAATFGARKDARSAAIIGCGMQAMYQIKALRTQFSLAEVRVFDIDRVRAEALATAATSTVSRVTAVASVREAVNGADICVTCTSSKSPVLTTNMGLDGGFIAAIGADNPEKHEIAPELMGQARILVDDLEACATGGDLHHALRAGEVTRLGVHAGLAELAAGRKQGRMSADDLVIFDSTGSGVQDVATAWLAFQLAARTGVGHRFDLSGSE